MTQVMNPARHQVQQVRPAQWQQMQAHLHYWRGCKQCKLGCQSRLINYVFFKGTVPCEVLFIGEAPGSSENATGIPFNNPEAAGGVFDNIITRCLELCPTMTWAVTNAVLCVPFDETGKKENREPSHDEILACRNRLTEFIQICQPLILVAMGNVALKATNVAGQFLSGGYPIPVLNPRHPSWMQRDGQDTELEIKRCVLSVTAAYQRLVK